MMDCFVWRVKLAEAASAARRKGWSDQDDPTETRWKGAAPGKTSPMSFFP